MKTYCFKTFKSISFFMILFILIFTNCKDKKSEDEVINYLNNKYEKSVTKDKYENSFRVVVDFSLMKSVEEKDLDYLRYIDNIEVIHMCECTITDKGIESLNSLKNLQVLTLNKTGLTDNALQMICQNHPKLERLEISFTPITSKGLKYIGKLKKLEQLYLRNTKIDDEATVYISQLENCPVIDLSNTNITDSSIENLLKFKNIGTGYITNTEIPNNGYLQLYIVNTKITKNGYLILEDHYKKMNSFSAVYWDPNSVPY